MRRDLVLLIIVLSACMIFVIVSAHLKEPRKLCMIPYDGDIDREDTIFVSVASYRDAECPLTLKNMFDSADVPERVFAGVCTQNATDDSPCDLYGKYKNNVRTLNIPHSEARGPTYARYLCSCLWKGEKYFFQIDSHTRFAKGWDTIAIEEFEKCGTKKAVLTHYPHSYDPKEGADAANTTVPALCKSEFDSNGMLTLNSVVLEAGETPKPVPYVAGGMMFGPGTMVRDVPFDPNLDHLFQGEEILYSSRLWTSGYDFFTPTRNIVYHYYTREEDPKFWNDRPSFWAINAKTLQTVKKLLRWIPGKEKKYRYDMGSARSLEDYWKFAGVDPQSKKVLSDHCG